MSFLNGFFIILLTCWWVASATRISWIWHDNMTKLLNPQDNGGWTRKAQGFQRTNVISQAHTGDLPQQKMMWSNMRMLLSQAPNGKPKIEGPMRTSKSPFGFFGIPTFLRHILLDSIGFSSRIATPALQRCNVRFQTTKGSGRVLIEVKLSSQSHSIPVQSALTSLTLY